MDFELEVIEDFVSVPETKKVNYNLYPNPTSDEVTVQLDNNAGENAHISVYNLQGRLVATSTFGLNFKAKVNLMDEVDGLYLVRIFDGNDYTQTKIMKMSK